MKDDFRQARESTHTAEGADLDPRRAIGFEGEDLAAEFMREQGWRVLARNYQLKIGEIDLVVRRSELINGRTEDTVAIVEVKSKQQPWGLAPEGSVTFAKRKRLVRLASAFVAKEKIKRVNIRFDVIAVDLSAHEPAIRHYPAAFDADAQIR